MQYIRIKMRTKQQFLQVKKRQVIKRRLDRESNINRGNNFVKGTNLGLRRPTTLAMHGPELSPTRILMPPRDKSSGSTGVSLATRTAAVANRAIIAACVDTCTQHEISYIVSAS